MKLTCPECGSQSIIFGRDYLHYLYWYQEPDEPTYYYDFEDGDNYEEYEECDIECSCQKCNHIWKIDGEASVDDYLDG